MKMNKWASLAFLAVVLAGFAAAPQAKADDNCVARSIGSLCRNPDNSLTYCGVGT
jgi:F0F1-type ATP synthase membrane subunit c/vacuolar-type H+-ATPase subunit K